MSEERLLLFSKDLLEEVLAEANAFEEGQFRETVFFNKASEMMVEAGACIDPSPCYYSARGMKVCGFDLHEEAGSLDLFITSFDGTTETGTVSNTLIETEFSRLAAFLDKSLGGLHRKIEESCEAYDLAQAIYQYGENITQANFFFITNGLVKLKKHENISVGDIDVSLHVWDIERLYQVACSNIPSEKIEIDFKKQFGNGVPCIGMTNINKMYDTYLALIPGKMLCEIYGKYGQRLLERNVRSYLQAKGKVNKGILSTLKNEPHMFVAYNNGISATADEVKINTSNHSGIEIVHAHNFQIVNGGQTTASIHNAFVKLNANIDNVFVQMKLTVLKNKDLEEEIVPLISRYANSQTKINISDFSANDSFHIKLEQLSRSMWAPNPAGKATTKWFYERARGSYLDELGRQGTPTLRNKFKLQFPSTQKITKTLLAKYEMCWMQKPYRVSEGNEKNFSHYCMLLKEKAGTVPDEKYFRELIAKAIIFKRIDAFAQKIKVPGYKANVVAYSVSLLSYLSGNELPLELIWTQQEITQKVDVMLRKIIPLVLKHITSQDRLVGNITEWCKKEECWITLKSNIPDIHALKITNEDWKKPTLHEKPPQGRVDDPGRKIPVPRDGDAIDAVLEIGPERLFTLIAWSKQKKEFGALARMAIFSVQQLMLKNKKPSQQQAERIVKLYRDAVTHGFRPN